MSRCLFAAAAAFALLALMVAAGCHCLPRHPYRSALVLLDIAAQDGPSRLKRTTPPPARTGVEYAAGGTRYRADLYVAADGIRAGILLVPGAAEEGKDDPRLVAFARTLARARFAVLVPDLPAFRQMKLGQRNVREVTDAMVYLLARTDLSPGGRAGAAAFSYAVGPVLLAALDPDVRKRLRFVVGIGGYYDLERVLAFFTTGWFEDYANQGPPLFLEPNEYGKWVFVLSNIDRLSSPADRELLQAIARRRLEDPSAPIEPLAQRLGPEGGAYYRFLSNREPQRVPQLIAQLPDEIKSEIDALNLARFDLGALGAQLILFHGRDDGIIPFTESVALARAVGRNRARLFILEGLAHVDVEELGWRDRLRLWCGIDALLQEQAPSGAGDGEGAGERP